MWRVKIIMSSEYVYVKGLKKLLSDGEFLFKLDSKDHAFEMPQIIPFGIPTIPCFYRSYFGSDVSGNFIRMIIHGAVPKAKGCRFEIIRSFHPSSCRNKLRATTSWKLVTALTGDCETIAETTQFYYKAASNESIRDFLCNSEELLELV